MICWFFVIFIPEPPVIRANGSSYNATVGSEVTLKCNIVNNGIPTAKYGWRRNGVQLQPEGEFLIEDSIIAIKLSNLTMRDAGKYTCSASNIRSYRSDFVKLRVLENGKH